MVEIGNVKEVIKDYIIKQLVSMGESSPAIRLLIPLAKRAITNNINSFDKFLKPIADKDGMIDIDCKRELSSDSSLFYLSKF